MPACRPSSTGASRLRSIACSRPTIPRSRGPGTAGSSPTTQTMARFPAAICWWGTCRRRSSPASLSENLAVAASLLARYRTAEAVRTPLLHCYLPCRAMGTPVEFVNETLSNPRFEGLVGIPDDEARRIADRLEVKFRARDVRHPGRRRAGRRLCHLGRAQRAGHGAYRRAAARTARRAAPKAAAGREARPGDARGRAAASVRRGRRGPCCSTSSSASTPASPSRFSPRSGRRSRTPPGGCGSTSSAATCRRVLPRFCRASSRTWAS